jgi:hypothetical protein
MPITIRRARAADAAQCGKILYLAFQKLADDHNFARDFPSVEVATGLISMLLATPGFYGIVAEGPPMGQRRSSECLHPARAGHWGLGRT